MRPFCGLRIYGRRASPSGRIERRAILSQPIVIACHSKKAVWLVSPVGKDRFVRIRVTKLYRLSFSLLGASNQLMHRVTDRPLGYRS